jgi:hypothetical protein
VSFNDRAMKFLSSGGPRALRCPKLFVTWITAPEIASSVLSGLERVRRRNRNGAAICDTGKVRRRAIRSTLRSSAFLMGSLNGPGLLALGGQAPITMNLSAVLTRKCSTFFLGRREDD